MRGVSLSRLFGLRLWFLGAVNALILLHIILYYAFDRRMVGCIDFFGLATFLGNGQITAGTIFLGAIILITLLLGRVFCGWGCHFALFQDLLSKLLDRVGFRVPFRRSRLELIVPPILFSVTLLYPIVAWWRRNGAPSGVSVDLAYPEVWHLLPGLKGVVLILLVDVVVLILLFGNRAFCRFVCPYGLFLKFFHLLAPTRVVQSHACSDCGACGRACPTGIPIKYELSKFGVVRDLNCMNCGDCVAACPEQALSIKPTKRAYSRGFSTGISIAGQPVWAEVVLLVAAIAGLLLYRGREYGDFLSVGLGLAAGATVVVAIKPTRFIRARWARGFTQSQLRFAGSSLALYLVLGMVGQAVGMDALKRGKESLADNDYEATVRTYGMGRRVADVFRPFTFYLDDFHERAKRGTDELVAEADRLMRSESWHDAELVYRAVIALQPDQIQAHGNLGTALLKQGRFWEAAASYLVVLRYDPNDLVALYHLAMTQIQLGQLDEAAAIVQKILSIDNVGNAYELIRGNPLFELLNQNATYRRMMAVYRPQRAAKSLGTREETR